MKKFIMLLLGGCLAISLSVASFAITTNRAYQGSDITSIYGSSFGEDIALHGRVFKADGEEFKNNDTLPSGSVLYYPIIVRNKNNLSTDLDWYFATTLSDIRDISPRLYKSLGSSLVDGADIVSKQLKELKYSDNITPVTEKVRCVEVRLNPYFGSKIEQEVAFSIQLREKSSIVFDTADYNKGPITEVYVGKEAEAPIPDNDPSSVTGYSARLRGGNLSFRVNENTRVVRLDEFNGSEVKSVTISGGNLDFTFEGDTIRQNPLYLQVNNKPIHEIEDKYFDYDLEYLVFPGTPVFDRLGTVSIGVDNDRDTFYLYEYVNGELQKIDARYDGDMNSLVFKTRRLGSFVISRNKDLPNISSVVIPDKPSEDITVGSTEKPGEDITVGSTEQAKPNFNSGDNNILMGMVGVGAVSVGVLAMLAYGKKKSK